MKRLEPAALLDALKWRYAVKKFDATRKIDPETWCALEETLILSPSSYGLQPWRFLVITDQTLKEALVPLSWDQRQLADASHVVIFAVHHPLTQAHVRKHVERTAEVHGIEVETLAGLEKMVGGYLETPGLDVRAWSSRQVYLALGMFMTAAAVLGVDTCPMEGLDPAAYDRALGLEGSGYFTVAACPAGYRAHDDKSAARAKVRFHPRDVLHRIPHTEPRH